ncbi:MAG: FMN-binding protein [Acidimicrobiia bacterium]
MAHALHDRTGGPAVWGDPLVDERLARLAARRTPTPPPPPGGRTPPATVRTGAAPGRKKRRHAAKGSRAAALAVSVVTTGGLSAYFAYVDGSSPVSAGGVPTNSATATDATPTTASTIAAPAAAAAGSSGLGSASASAAATTIATTGTGSTGLADGTFVGETATNRWGPVQVQVTVSNGEITDVTTLQSPDSERKSVQINDYATPILRQETLTAQSADIDTVSGATYTSIGYAQSLQSALDTARAQAVG